MLRSLWKRVVSYFKRDSEQEPENRFVPSELDRSVRYAHGGSRQDIARELEDIEEQADVLEERQYD